MASTLDVHLLAVPDIANIGMAARIASVHVEYPVTDRLEVRDWPGALAVIGRARPQRAYTGSPKRRSHLSHSSRTLRKHDLLQS